MTAEGPGPMEFKDFKKIWGPEPLSRTDDFPGPLNTNRPPLPHRRNQFFPVIRSLPSIVLDFLFPASKK